MRIALWPRVTKESMKSNSIQPSLSTTSTTEQLVYGMESNGSNRMELNWSSSSNHPSIHQHNKRQSTSIGSLTSLSLQSVNPLIPINHFNQYQHSTSTHISSRYVQVDIHIQHSYSCHLTLTITSTRDSEQSSLLTFISHSRSQSNLRSILFLISRFIIHSIQIDFYFLLLLSTLDFWNLGHHSSSSTIYYSVSSTSNRYDWLFSLTSIMLNSVGYARRALTETQNRLIWSWGVIGDCLGHSGSWRLYLVILLAGDCRAGLQLWVHLVRFILPLLLGMGEGLLLNWGGRWRVIHTVLLKLEWTRTTLEMSYYRARLRFCLCWRLDWESSFHFSRSSLVLLYSFRSTIFDLSYPFLFHLSVQ